MKFNSHTWSGQSHTDIDTDHTMVEDSYDNCQAQTVNTVYPDCLFKHTSETLSTVKHQSQLCHSGHSNLTGGVKVMHILHKISNSRMIQAALVQTVPDNTNTMAEQTVPQY